MEGINTHTELYGTGADPDIITLGPKVGGHPGWPTYEHKCGMSFEAYKRGTPVLAPFDMVLVGFRDTSTQVLSGGTSAHSDDVKLFFESASPDWPGVYMTVYHLLTSPLLTGRTQSASNDLAAPPAQGYQLFWDGNYTLSPTGNAASYDALIGYKVKRGELIGFAGTVPTPDGVGHSFADFYFFVPDTSINPNIKNGNRNLHLVQPGSFFYWKCFSPSATFPAGVLAYPFECDGYQLPIEQRDVNFKYTPTNSTKPTPTPSPTEPFARQTRAEVVTNNAASNSPWGGHQGRIVHTQDGVFTAYFAESSSDVSRVWQLAKKQSDDTWVVIAQGETGMNPVDLLASPDGTLHIIGFTKGIGTIWSGKPKNGTLVMTSTVIPAVIPRDFQGSNALRYSSCIDTSGNLCILLSFGGKGAGAQFSWAYYVQSKSQWVTKTNQLDYMYTYTYLFPGLDGQFSLVATRDVSWAELGYTQPSGSVNWVMNAFRYWRTNDIISESIKVLSYAEETPTDQYPEPYLNAQTDAYLDTKDRMHILYSRRGATTGGKTQYRHRIVSASGAVLFDEELPGNAGGYSRIFQDSQERFYLLSQSGFLYPMDQEGKSLGDPIKLDLGGHKVEYSGYALSVPRTGTPLSDAMDIVFPSDNGRSWLYFRLDFSGK